MIISPKKLKNTNYFFFYSASSRPSSIAADTEMFISFIQNLCLSPPAKNSSSAVTTTTTITSSTFLLLCIRKISYIFSRTILSTSKIFLERRIELFSSWFPSLGIPRLDLEYPRWNTYVGHWNSYVGIPMFNIGIPTWVSNSNLGIPRLENGLI